MSKIYIGSTEVEQKYIGEMYDDQQEFKGSPKTESSINKIEYKEDIIEHPKHYTFGSIEPIDVIEDWQLDFRLANVVKYIARAGKKDPQKKKQDLEKALWYLKRYIDKEC
jgi:CRISPR/Cas system-associated protein Cas5 (RAMP superfamily)